MRLLFTCVLLLASSTAHGTQQQVVGARPDQLTARPSLIDYTPSSNPDAVVISPDKLARFTVLTPYLIRMEYAAEATGFEDHATIAILNRDLGAPPKFTHDVADGTLTITTTGVIVSYAIGQPFSSSSLKVTSNDPSSAFDSWAFGDAFPGNLLGTIRGLDQQNLTPLNCTENRKILDNGEENHCEWAVISRDGWVVYDDSKNYLLDENDWWVPINTPAPAQCNPPKTGTDVVNEIRSASYPNGTTATSQDDCCDKCMAAEDCIAWVFATDSNKCWPLAGWSAQVDADDSRSFGITRDRETTSSLQNQDDLDLYGFFHGHDYFGALNDFVAVSGKTIMVPRYTAGVWWSRWYDLNNMDVIKVIDDHASRAIPLDVFVLDMNWHSKDDWTGFTFDSNLFPYPRDTMDYLHELGLAVTINVHDADGISDWEDRFPALVADLGLPAGTTNVPMNLLNATVAYAVEDIIIGDLINDKHVDFLWIDWQQGGDRGGLTGTKQNPTIWLNHLRCTDRHRNGDDTRALVLARWGGLGGHRYQVGFSGDVRQLNWANLAYQPYFSATAANVGHAFWSHDIEGPAGDMEMYTRWIQVGAFSGIMRSHDRGMSAGGCANDDKFSCSIVEPWNTPNTNFPDSFMEANRLALQFRAHLLPYIYNGHRSAFDSGVGVVRPMYYHWPELDAAYLMDANGTSVQYMFGPSILFSPVVQAGNTTQVGQGPGLANKTTWLPPGDWVDVNTGVFTSVEATDTTHLVTSAYAINQVPLWYVAGSVIPYIPLRSLSTSVGNAAKQYTFLGFKVVPGSSSGSTQVYEDDGSTTAYLTANAYAFTTASYSTSGSAATVTISTNGTYAQLPKSRAYQIRFVNSGPVSSVTVNGKTVPFNRYGRIASTGKVPSQSQHYYDFSLLPDGMGAVIDVVDASTAQDTTVTVSFAEPAPSVDALSGVYGAVTHALWAKGNLDIERTTPGSTTGQTGRRPIIMLSSVGKHLEFLAGNSTIEFVSALKAVPGLLKEAISDISIVDSTRTGYSVALLQSAMP